MENSNDNFRYEEPVSWKEIYSGVLEDIIKFRSHIALGLIIIGVLLVWFSESLGIGSVRQWSGGSWSWQPDQAHHAAERIRFVGAMFFAAGLWERLLMQIAKLKVN